MDPPELIHKRMNTTEQCQMLYFLFSFEKVRYGLEREQLCTKSLQISGTPVYKKQKKKDPYCESLILVKVLWNLSYYHHPLHPAVDYTKKSESIKHLYLTCCKLFILTFETSGIPYIPKYWILSPNDWMLLMFTPYYYWFLYKYLLTKLRVLL